MLDKELFYNWLLENAALSEASRNKYCGAVNTVNKEMFTRSVLKSSIWGLNVLELDIAIEKIFKDMYFLDKDKKGNKMYSNALKHYRSFVWSEQSQGLSSQNIDDIAKSLIRKDTEKNTIIKARIGQGEFRKKLLEKYSNACIVTGLTYKPLLVASHIRPWAVCDDDSRIDKENGLLLSANIDRLFDGGSVSFKNDGKIVLSSMLTQENVKKLHLEKIEKVDLKCSSKMEKYLEYHRDVIFVR